MSETLIPLIQIHQIPQKHIHKHTQIIRVEELFGTAGVEEEVEELEDEELHAKVFGCRLSPIKHKNHILAERPATPQPPRQHPQHTILDDVCRSGL